MTEEKKKLETVIGTLTIWDGNDITVDGKKYPMCIKAASWVRDHNYAPGIQITLEIDAKGIVQRAYPTKQATGPDPEKLKQYGFGQPTPGPGEAAANAAKDKAEGAANMAENAKYAQELAAGRGKAPETPASAPAKEPAPSEDTSKPKKIEGQIVFLDKAAHRITIKDKAGVSHSFLYGKPLEEKIGTLQQWWFAGVIGEFDKGMNSWIATGISFFQRPDDWPARQGRGSRGNYQPRNERLIAFLALHRDSVALFQSTTTPDTVTFEDAERIVYEQAKNTLERAMKDFGGNI